MIPAMNQNICMKLKSSTNLILERNDNIINWITKYQEAIRALSKIRPEQENLCLRGNSIFILPKNPDKLSIIFRRLSLRERPFIWLAISAMFAKQSFQPSSCRNTSVDNTTIRKLFTLAKTCALLPSKNH